MWIFAYTNKKDEISQSLLLFLRLRLAGTFPISNSYLAAASAALVYKCCFSFLMLLQLLVIALMAVSQLLLLSAWFRCCAGRMK